VRVAPSGFGLKNVCPYPAGSRRKRAGHRPKSLVLDTTTTGTFGSLDALLIRLDFTTGHRSHHTTRRLPRSLQITSRRLAHEVDLDKVTLESALERDDGLYEQRVRVLEVNVHDSHHADAHQLRLVELAELLEIVGFDRGRDKLGLFARAHGRRLDVLDDGHI
jgi:hypothetical protein